MRQEKNSRGRCVGQNSASVRLVSQSSRHGQLSDQGWVIIWQANGGDHAGPLRNIMSATQLRHFGQVRDHLGRESAPSVASKTVDFEPGVVPQEAPRYAKFQFTWHTVAHDYKSLCRNDLRQTMRHGMPTYAGMPGGNVTGRQIGGLIALHRRAHPPKCPARNWLRFWPSGRVRWNRAASRRDVRGARCPGVAVLGERGPDGIRSRRSINTPAFT